MTDLAQLLTDLDEAMEARVAHLESENLFLLEALKSRNRVIAHLEDVNKQLHHVVNRLTEELGELYYQMSET